MRLRLLACCYNDPEMRIDPDTVYPIRPDCRDDAPKTRFKPRVFLSPDCYIISCSPVPMSSGQDPIGTPNKILFWAGGSLTQRSGTAR